MKSLLSEPTSLFDIPSTLLVLLSWGTKRQVFVTQTLLSLYQ